MIRLRSTLGLLCAGLLSVAIVTHPEPASAESEGAWWIPAVGASLIYTPIKVLTAAGGAILGSGAWLVLGGDDAVARDIIKPAVTGDYWSSPTTSRARTTSASWVPEGAARRRPDLPQDARRVAVWPNSIER